MKHSTVIKSIGAIFVLGSLLSIPQISLAANIGLDRSIAGKTAANIKRVHPTPVPLDFSQYVDKENSNLHYEDESISIDIMPMFDYVTLVQPNGHSAHVSDYDNALYMYGQNHNIISISGVDILMKNKTDKPGESIKNEVLEISVGSAKALGMVTPEGFVVMHGATLNEKISEKSLTAGIVKLRKNYAEDGRVKDLKTTEDLLFSSSSAAADFILGYSVSGPKTWKTKDGHTLKEIESSKADIQLS